MSDEKRPEDTPAGELVPQKHGGAIRRGSQKGNTPGPGRPASAIRRDALDRYDVHIQTLDDIASNEDSRDADRVAAVRELGRVGMGASTPNSEIRRKLRVQREYFESKLPVELLDDVLDFLTELWD